MSLCALLLAVQLCDPRAAMYGRVAQELPGEHLALIRSVEVWDRSYGRSSTSGHVWLPETQHRMYPLAHEVGHLVLWRDGRRLLTAFRARFWPGGKPLGEPSGYGRREGGEEDAADAYAALFTRDVLDEDRAAWLCREVAELSAHPVCGRWRT